MTARGKKTLTVLPSPAVLGAGAPTTNGKKPPGPISTIITTGRPLRSVTADGLLALVTANDPPSIFQRGRQLVRIRMDGGTPFIEPLTEAALCGILDRTAKFMRIAPNGLIPVAPPVRVVRDLAALPAWPGIPELAGLTESPTLRPDGSITTTPGYDPETRLIYAPASGLAIPPIPEHPTTDDLARACELIKDLLRETGYTEALEAERTIEAQGRIENLAELVNVATEYDAGGEGDRSLADFLQQVSLRSDADERVGSVDIDERGLAFNRHFHHNEQSLRVVDVLERDGRGLNLSSPVRDGILCHSWRAVPPSTLEGAIVRYADRVTYINHDIDDALRAGVLTVADLPPEPIAVLGSSGPRRIDALVHDLVEHSEPAGAIVQGDAAASAMSTLREFMFERVYMGPEARREHAKIELVVRSLFEHYCSAGDEIPDTIPDGPIAQRVTDYLAGMTDRFCIRAFEALSMPAAFAP